MQSPLWIIISLLIGFGYAILLYSKKYPWSQQTNFLIAFLRFFLVSVIIYLLVSPYFKQNSTRVEKPLIVVAIDNSSSLQMGTSKKELQTALNSLQQLYKELNNDDVNVEVILPGQRIETSALPQLSFDGKRTDLSGLLNEIDNNYESRNLTSVVLLTDGIYNHGSSPLYRPYKFNVYTVGIGDTVPKRDLILDNPVYNKIAGIDNQFPLQVDVKSIGYEQINATVLLKENGKTLATKEVNLTRTGDMQQITFLTSSKSKGLHHFILEIKHHAQERTFRNNTAHAYIDIIDSKQNILLVAGAPHPDIKAITNAIAANDNVKIDVCIPGMHEYKPGNYDLVIFYQVPNVYGSGSDMISTMINKKIPMLFIVGNQSNIPQLNLLFGDFKMMVSAGQTDKVTPEFSPTFTRFLFDAVQKSELSTWPPLSVPFGEFSIGSWEPVLIQKVGTIATTKPLLACRLGGNTNIGCLLGEGIWQWRLAEYATHENSKVFDDFFSKLIQLLAKKEDKRKFRITLPANEFQENDAIFFQTEVYNDIFEPVFDNDISLNIKDESGKLYNYQYKNTHESKGLMVNGLPPGLYKYEASTLINSKKEMLSGDFSIADINLEDLLLTADFEILRQLAKQNGGFFVPYTQIPNLQKQLTQNRPKGIVYNSENLLEIINIQWIFYLLILLGTIEWSVRKYLGAY